MHAAVYALTFVVLATGWQLLSGREGRPSPLARALGTPDIEVHLDAGWLLAALGAVSAVVGWRATVSLFRESVIFERSDLDWFARWPRAVFDGRFPAHGGDFDPGQRIANLIMVAGLVIATASGIGLTRVHGGAVFVWLLAVHRWSTFVTVPVIAGHVLVASGILPGYRGVWRSMHLGGRIGADVARRLWPGWTERRGGR